MWALPYEWIRRQTAGAVRQGLSFDALLQDSLIDLEYGDHRDVVGPAQALLLCMNTVLQLQDSAHGLANACIQPLHSALSLRVALGCNTLEAAINASTRLYETVSTAVRFNLTTQHDLAILSVSVNAPSFENAIQLEDIYLSWLYMHCIYFFGRPMPVVDVVVRDPSHYSLGRRHLGIGAPVRLGSVASIRFSKGLLAARPSNRGGNNDHWEVARLWLDFVQGKTGAHNPLYFAAGKGVTRLKDIAEEKSVSRSTIRRRLQFQEGGFRGARERALVEVATRLLIGNDNSVESVAAELGYADARNFRRFFKNATGLTPQQYRSHTRNSNPSKEQQVLEKLANQSARFWVGSHI